MFSVFVSLCSLNIITGKSLVLFSTTLQLTHYLFGLTIEKIEDAKLLILFHLNPSEYKLTTNLLLDTSLIVAYSQLFMSVLLLKQVACFSDKKVEFIEHFAARK